ncbi:putative zinc-binding metallopeptidase [Thiomicrorhabdus sp.]|uniref:zinc-binding metallopeptidase family protein n=1 Tax=Thiomicrorhabdus sp. TaxID=2039724 RepID=UPI0029C7E845|nr:putative zinc-binding metallopeptidase [Thiomicrorhabdus sp.]
MKRFFCQCDQEVFFNDLFCPNCGRDLCYDPDVQTMWSGEIALDGLFYTDTSTSSETISFKLCENRYQVVECNWALSRQAPDSSCQCISCRTTRTIPDQTVDRNRFRWQRLENAKRRLFHTLLELQLFTTVRFDEHNNLCFDFMEDQRSNPNVAIEHLLTGHNNGLITINAAEADEGFLHAMKEQMKERYRTLLGHFRHEIGHYFWDKLMHNESSRERFREVFGDERQNYEQALKYYYDSGKQHHWRGRYITPYAGSHPHEDWAETWAHYLHIVDTLETAVGYGLSVYEPKENDFDSWFDEWGRVAQVMNALNRSMGLAPPYPFKLSDIVAGKLRFIDERIESFNAELSFNPHSCNNFGNSIQTDPF